MGIGNSIGTYRPGKPSLSIVPSIYRLSCHTVEKLRINDAYLLVFRVQGVSEKDIGGSYTVKLKPSNTNIKLFDSKKQDKYEFSVEKGWKFSVYVSGTKVVENERIDIEVDGIKMLTIPISIHQDKDVFSNTDAKRLIGEIMEIKKYVNKEEGIATHREYEENYCMQAAERGISELLKNYTDFYAVERGTHKHKNKIGFSGLSAIERGNKIKENGFVSSAWKFNNYDIDHAKRKIINDSNSEKEAKANYDKVIYDIVILTEANKKILLERFKKDINNRIGFHVYYFSVSDGFHTLLLVIDNHDPCNPTYAIYDQHGKSTTSYGRLDDITEGLRKQTSWTFANSCLNRFKGKKTSSWDGIETMLWKIQRK